MRMPPATLRGSSGIAIWISLRVVLRHAAVDEQQQVAQRERGAEARDHQRDRALRVRSRSNSSRVEQQRQRRRRRPPRRRAPRAAASRTRTGPIGRAPPATAAEKHRQRGQRDIGAPGEQLAVARSWRSAGSSNVSVSPIAPSDDRPSRSTRPSARSCSISQCACAAAACRRGRARRCARRRRSSARGADDALAALDQDRGAVGDARAPPSRSARPAAIGDAAVARPRAACRTRCRRASGDRPADGSSSISTLRRADQRARHRQHLALAAREAPGAAARAAARGRGTARRAAASALARGGLQQRRARARGSPRP